MDTEWMLVAALVLLSAGFLLTILGQAMKIKILQEENQRLRPNENHEELIELVNEKVKILGDVKTIKYLREHKGMSMLDAKKVVDSAKS